MQHEKFQSSGPGVDELDGLEGQCTGVRMNDGDASARGRMDVMACPEPSESLAANGQLADEDVEALVRRSAAAPQG